HGDQLPTPNEPVELVGADPPPLAEITHAVARPSSISHGAPPAQSGHSGRRGELGIVGHRWRSARDGLAPRPCGRTNAALRPEERAGCAVVWPAHAARGATGHPTRQQSRRGYEVEEWLRVRSRVRLLRGGLPLYPYVGAHDEKSGNAGNVRRKCFVSAHQST